ncbi:uncharacterized protein LOC131605900 [Vicia villosa]|uniref:uncharacterized protein LOC131605900 n=1 Tax=Vicia villosa TaxID=3911 RepID=UPI00273B517E|nr:uncharacterized protein LOC131605900 [Vicia villosa]
MVRVYGKGQWQVAGGGRDRKLQWDIAREGGRRMNEKDIISSFFITEFGVRWRARDLLMEFKELGDIEEVFIPPKKDKFGRRYGFVRFLNVKDEVLLATKLDNVVLEGRKIFANLPRFSRGKEESVDTAKKNHPGVKKVFKNNSSIGFGGTVKGRTYADATLRRSGVLREETQVPRSLSYQPNNEELTQYSKAFTGRIREPEKMNDIKKIFHEEGIFNIRVTSLGPNFCLMEDLVGGDVETFIEERKSWWSQWLWSITPWKPSDIDTGRFAWLKVVGVPCHAWGEKCFALLVGNRGKLVKTEEATMLKHSMAEAVICILTESKERIEEKVILILEGQSFVINLFEIAEIQEISFRKREGVGDSDSESSSAPELFLSDEEERDRRKITEEADVTQRVEGTGEESIANEVKSVGRSEQLSREKGWCQEIHEKVRLDLSDLGKEESFDAKSRKVLESIG